MAIDSFRGVLCCIQVCKLPSALTQITDPQMNRHRCANKWVKRFKLSSTLLEPGLMLSKKNVAGDLSVAGPQYCCKSQINNPGELGPNSGSRDPFPPHISTDPGNY